MTTPCCPKCGLPLNVWHAASHLEAECKNLDCPRAYITLELDVLLALTDEQAARFTRQQSFTSAGDARRQKYLDDQAALKAKYGDRLIG